MSTPHWVRCSRTFGHTHLSSSRSFLTCTLTSSGSSLSATSGDVSIASREAVAIAAQSLNDSSSGGVPGRAVPSRIACRPA